MPNLADEMRLIAGDLSKLFDRANAVANELPQMPYIKSRAGLLAYNIRTVSRDAREISEELSRKQAAGG